MSFTKKDTFAAKGIATVLLLIHHLFYTADYSFSDFFIGKSGYVNLAKISKICVAMFLILSGYGLAKSFEKHTASSFSFVKQHLLKLYIGFWTIFAISLIPLFFSYKNATFNSVFGGNLNFFLEFFGIRFLFGEYGYNPTWWFLSLIIIMYCMFPLLYKCVKKYPYEILLFSYFIFLVGGFFSKTPVFSLIKNFSFPFVLGIFSAEKGLFENIKQRTKEKRLLLILLSIGLCFWRLKTLKNTGAGSILIFDGLTAYSVIISLFVCLNIESKTAKFLIFIGKNSMNIFLMHTFIYGIYFTEFTYFVKNPLLILIHLLFVCLLFSFVLEKIKDFFKISFKRGKKNLSP